MKYLILKISNLIDVKSIMTLGLLYTFMAMCLKGVISSENFMLVMTSVITFYFAKRDNK